MVHIFSEFVPLFVCVSQVWEGRRERGGSSQQKRKPRDSMEAMLPKSLGTSDSEIQGVIVCQWWIPRRWMQAWGLHSSPRNLLLTHYDSEDFWVWRAKGLRQHCFHTVPWLLFLLTTFDCFYTSYILIIITIPRISFFLTCPISAGYVRVKWEILTFVHEYVSSLL